MVAADARTEVLEKQMVELKSQIKNINQNLQELSGLKSLVKRMIRGKGTE